ncbi:iron complex outermembrane receptor protein [Tahibacter aquaticus]|uniref:Iron complex outermembrane receptor protein n=1 Tax=Tahibacter aquaticus TaxID=520092 RepID=A0A4R6Z9L8_9GAMM|nr:TonB-dependent receptor [Tahibacter aquaticus]TDR48414.1 iron complex outermembrane receptor protein [Tahibacter aquaticus]
MQTKNLVMAIVAVLCAQSALAQPVATNPAAIPVQPDATASDDGAQAAPASAASSASAAPLDKAAATPPQDDPAALEMVTVTAQRREENVQKIPVAVAVISGDALERANAVDVSNLAALIPSVTFSAGNELRNNSIRLRGVGTDVFSTGVEASVSTVVDGVVLQRPGSAFSDLGDIERIEVLRGPQGTLFGKNSSAGVINVVTRAPDFDYRTGDLSFLAAQDNEYRVNGAVSGPLGNGFAYRMAGFYRSQDGNVTNRATGDSVNGQEAYGFRGKLAWKADDSPLDLLFSGDYSKLDAQCCALPLIIASDNPRAVITGTPVGRDNDQVNNDVDPFVRQKNYGASLTANLALGEYTLTSISAYRRFDNESDVDLDNTQGQFIRSNFNIESSTTKTQELRLSSPRGGVLDYVLGAYYFNGSAYNFLDRRGLNIGAIETINPDGSVVPRVPGDEAVLTGNSVVDTRNFSLFGQANWHIGERLTLTGGLRHLKEDQRLRFVRPIAGFFNGSNQPATNPAFGPVTGNYDDSATIGKASATYQFTPQFMGYLSYSTGYKSEGLAATLGLSAAQFAQLPAPAETSKLIEAGVKTQLFDNRLWLNFTGFRTRFADYQAQTFNSAAGLVVLTSAGGVAIDGAEVEITARPLRNLSISGGVTWLDARFEDVPNGPCYTGQTAAQGCAPAAAGGPPVQNLNGKPFVNAPDLRYTVSGRYEVPLSGDIDGYLQADYRWQEAVVFDISQNPKLTQDAYGVADLSLGLIFGGGKYDLGLFVKNVFDQQYSAGMMAVGTAGGANAYAQQVGRDFRRYAGVTFRAHF